MDGILGTNASFSADITLLLYIFVLAPAMIGGYIFARRKMFVPHHKFVMTSIVVLNWVLIFVVMALSYSSYVAPSLGNISSDVSIALPTLHLLTGSIAQLLGTYLVLLMWTENTSLERIVIVRIKNIKLPMRITLGLWAITIALGILLYVVWYLPVDTASANEGNVVPVATEEAFGEEATPEVFSEEASGEVNETGIASTEEAGESASEEDEAEPASTEEASQ